MQYLFNNRLSFVTFSQDDIATILENLESSKLHRHNNINIYMLKSFGPEIFRPLAMFFKQYIDTAFSSFEWKKGNIVLIHKKTANKY